MNIKNSLTLFSSLAIAAGICACSKDPKTSGVSEETEGIVALEKKSIVGVSQKGPFVTGSNVYLRETAADGSLEPTGKEFFATTRSDKGDFRIDNINLESQYALLSVEGYFISETTDEVSKCPIRLNAVSDLEKRETVNINLLTHFEFKRVLSLVKSGKSFAEAKKQAATEILDTYGVEVKITSAEDLDIYNFTEADRVLFNISLNIDNMAIWNGGDDDEYCQSVQDFLDSFADDFADDGKLSDSLMLPIVYEAYITADWYSDMIFVTEEDIKKKEKKDPDEAKDHGLAIKKSEYDFSNLVILHYLEASVCDEKLWGNYQKFDKPFIYNYETRNDGYILCNGFNWDYVTKEQIDDLTAKIAHKTGTMTDKRDGRKYSTVSFEYNGKKYEWMAENLLYTDSTVSYSKGADKNKQLVGSYSWTTAMQIDSKYMENSIDEDLIDSLHQGICPDGWHISTSEEWATLIEYVGGPQNLLNENWVSSNRETAVAKGLIGVYFDKFDFNLTPMDPIYLETSYHAYTIDNYYLAAKPDSENGWHRAYDKDFPIDVSNFFTIAFYFDTIRIPGTERQSEGYVRCVKN